MKKGKNKTLGSLSTDLEKSFAKLNKPLPTFELPDFDFKLPNILEDMRIHELNFQKEMESVYRKNNEEAEIRRLQLEVLRKQINNTIPKNPVYNIKTSVLTFAGNNIQIPLNTKEEMLCKVVLKDKESMEKQWSWDEICEAWGNEIDEKQRDIIYRAGKRVRDSVARKTGISDFILVTTKTIQVHPLYLSPQ